MPQILLFIAAVAGMLSIVPAVTLIATGSWRATWEAMKGYLMVLGILYGIGGLVGLLLCLAFMT